jgi:ATP-binding cassette subfamily B multidrug efflux pump
MLGHATDVIVDGVTPAPGIDFGALCARSCSSRSLYVASPVLMAWLQAYLLAGVVQRTMKRCAPTSRTSSTACRSSLRRPPAPRRPAQPGHQRHRQRGAEPPADPQPDAHLDAHLVGVLVMMFTISPLLALVALVTIPLSLFVIKHHRRPLEEALHRPVAHTGALNAQVEEAFTGHSS